MRTIVEEDGDEILIGVFETNAKDSRSYAGDLLDRYVAAARAQLTGERAPSALAGIATRVLEDHEEFRQKIGAVIFAAVRLGTTIHVCTAGDIRVHAVRDDDTVPFVTRDHNAVDDDAEGVYGDILPSREEFMAHVLTRTLPTTKKKPLECVEWDRNDLAALLLCSSAVHQYRPPETYVASLLQDRQVPAGGFLAIAHLKR